jgi:histidinol-phosphate aminotransferase
LTPAALATMRARIGTLCDERDRLARSLPKSDEVLAVYPSVTNFLCVRFTDAARAYARLCASGIIVRDVSHYPGLAGCLRVTVGTPEENRALLAALDLREARQ